MNSTRMHNAHLFLRHPPKLFEYLLYVCVCVCVTWIQFDDESKQDTKTLIFLNFFFLFQHDVRAEALN